jgi:hypothetical protein
VLAFEKAKPTPTSAATSGRATRRCVNLSHAQSRGSAAPEIRCQAHNSAIYARIFSAIDIVSSFCRRLAFAAPKTIADHHAARPEQIAIPSITPLSRHAGSIWNQVWREAAYS